MSQSIKFDSNSPVWGFFILQERWKNKLKEWSELNSLPDDPETPEEDEPPVPPPEAIDPGLPAEDSDRADARKFVRRQISELS